MYPIPFQEVLRPWIKLCSIIQIISHMQIFKNLLLYVSTSTTTMKENNNAIDILVFLISKTTCWFEQTFANDCERYQWKRRNEVCRQQYCSISSRRCQHMVSARNNVVLFQKATSGDRISVTSFPNINHPMLNETSFGKQLTHIRCTRHGQKGQFHPKSLVLRLQHTSVASAGCTT